MRAIPAIILGLAVIWLAPVSHAQTDGSTKSDSTSERSTEDTQREAVDALMGETSSSGTKSRTTEGTRSTKGTKSDSQPKGATSAAGDQPTKSTRSSSGSRTAPSGAVPEVPLSTGVTVPGDLAPGTQPVTPTTQIPPATAPAVPEAPTTGDYRSPATAAPETSAAEGANAAGTENATAAPGASPATAIIIGLIVLAVLLVALAAVVGVMAAQRARPPEVAAAAAAAAAGVPAGWAYLSAPEAPNISLHKSPFVIGSSPSCELRLADPKASPQHARIERTSDGYVLTDMNSLNGTYLNGERIASPVSLRPGDQVRMGDIAVTFEVYSG